MWLYSAGTNQCHLLPLLLTAALRCSNYGQISPLGPSWGHVCCDPKAAPLQLQGHSPIATQEPAELKKMGLSTFSGPNKTVLPTRSFLGIKTT